ASEAERGLDRVLSIVVVRSRIAEIGDYCSRPAAVDRPVEPIDGIGSALMIVVDKEAQLLGIESGSSRQQQLAGQDRKLATFGFNPPRSVVDSSGMRRCTWR